MSLCGIRLGQFGKKRGQLQRRRSRASRMEHVTRVRCSATRRTGDENQSFL